MAIPKDAGLRVKVTLEIEMTADQVQTYADEYGLRDEQGRIMARTIVEHIRTGVLTGIQDCAAFGEQGAGKRGATVTLLGK